MPMKGGWVTIMTNRAFGFFYVGVTNDLTRRHSAGKNTEHWPRERKIGSIMAENPNWNDLFDGFSG